MLSAPAAALALGLGGCAQSHTSLTEACFPRSSGVSLVSATRSPEDGWSEGSELGALRLNFHGFGTVVLEETSSTLRIAPGISTGASETHATLLTSTAIFGDVDATYRMRTTAHLRVGQPNPWEVGWALWHYTSSTSFYYFLVKPNGWELGKVDPAYPGSQRFLATGRAAFDPFAWHDIHVVQRGATMTVDVDGRRIVEFTDHERPYFVGAIGLYSEDAAVEFDDVRASSAP